MTTIAYKDGVMAGDRLITMGSSRVGQLTKVFRLGEVLVGASGDLVCVEKMLAWVRAAMPGEYPAFKDADSNARVIVVYRDWVVTLTPGGMDVMKTNLTAIGTGWGLATGAMLAGASAEEAVRLASKVDIYTGPEIDVIRRPEPVLAALDPETENAITAASRAIRNLRRVWQP